MQSIGVPVSALDASARAPLSPLPALSGYLVLSGVAIFAAVWLTRGFGYPRQVNGLRIAEWVNANVKAGESVGAWNAGVVGYVSERPVVNLDGVTNNDLYRWVKERGAALDPAAVIPYAAERGLTYVTDYENILEPVLATPAGARLSPVYRVPDSYVVIYRLR